VSEKAKPLNFAAYSKYWQFYWHGHWQCKQ